MTNVKKIRASVAGLVFIPQMVFVVVVSLLSIAAFERGNLTSPLLLPIAAVGFLVTTMVQVFDVWHRQLAPAVRYYEYQDFTKRVYELKGALSPAGLGKEEAIPEFKKLHILALASQLRTYVPPHLRDEVEQWIETYDPNTPVVYSSDMVRGAYATLSNKLKVWDI